MKTLNQTEQDLEKIDIRLTILSIVIGFIVTLILIFGVFFAIENFMKVKELKADQKVSINSFEYLYKGECSVRQKGIGTVKKIAFKSLQKNVEDKYFDLSILKTDIKKLKIELV